MRITLTDFSLPKWRGFTLSSIEKSIDLLPITLYSEFEHPLDNVYDIISHDKVCVHITNIKIENRVCSGEIIIIDSQYKEQIENLMRLDQVHFSIRCYSRNREMGKIITWDLYEKN